MAHRRVAPVLVIALATALAVLPGSFGCAGTRNRSEPDGAKAVTAQKPSQLTKPISDSLAAELAKPTGPITPPQNVLAISGGGQYAAYNAGLVVGWTEAGNRPKFDVVTGISSGAIVACYAFLGERYDERLTQFFTTTRQKDLFVFRPVVELIRNGSLASSKRLEELLGREINDCFLFDLREAHKEGRRLYVGTMNAKTRRLVIWDLGAVACSDRADAGELVQKILLAATAYPGLLPPVEFDVVVDGQRYVEQHVDGGAVSQAFLRLGPCAERPADGVTGWLCGSNLYAMAAGKLFPPQVEGEVKFLSRVGGSISAALYALYRAELVNMYAFCGVSGMKFHLNAVPEETEVPPNSMSFDAAAMRRLYTLGHQAAKKGIPWRFTPPGAEPGEEERPQGGETLDRQK
jgi:predicted patatin/cPLA2 family phospholipase